MNCEACQEAGPIYEAGCPGCEARALASFDRERMARALMGESIQIPPGLSPDEIREFIILKGKQC